MADFAPDRAVIDAAQRKRVKYEAKCATIGYGFLPFSFSSLGELEKDADILLKQIRKFSLAQDIRARVAVYIFNRIGFAIAKGVGAQIVSRLPTNGGFRRSSPSSCGIILISLWFLHHPSTISVESSSSWVSLQKPSRFYGISILWFCVLYAVLRSLWVSSALQAVLCSKSVVCTFLALWPCWLFLALWGFVIGIKAGVSANWSSIVVM
ncbi:hypothetical protein Tco_1034618 [Tanacetum coccineum]